MPYAITGYPTTSPNELRFNGVTSYHGRYADSYILGSTLSTTDHTFGSIYNKIFTSEIFINEGLAAANPSGVKSASDKLIFGILESKNNPVGLTTAALRGYTLFIKYGDEGAAANVVPYDNIREKSTSWTAYIGVTKNGFTFTMNRYSAFALGFRDFGNNSSGLTGQYVYYLINAEPNNNGELIWRMAFSFGGTSGTLYNGPPVWHDGYSAWFDYTKPQGPSFWINNDGCMQGALLDATNSRQSSNYPPPNPSNPADGLYDPFPMPVDYVR
jgi:hypothetical protein